MMANSFNNWQAIADALIPACKDAVANTAQKAQSNIQDVIKTNGQIDTGRMYNGIYNVSAEGSNYPGGDKMLPDVPKPESELEATVAAGAEYSVFQNNGTIYIAPRPFFEPGMDRTRADFDAAMETVAKRLEDAAK
jgi:HK97 gp10 family phage protein